MVISGNATRGVGGHIEGPFHADCKKAGRSPETRRSAFANCPSSPAHNDPERGGSHLSLARLREMVHKLSARKSAFADYIRTNRLGSGNSQAACNQGRFRSLG